MLELRVLVDQPKEWLDYLAAFSGGVTAISAVVTVIVALRIANNQNSLQKALADREERFRKAQLDQQERQLRKDLFDRRFEVYLGVRDFMRYVAGSPDEIRPNSPESQTFRDLTEKAEMLFGDDVYNYMLRVGNIAGEINVINGKLRAQQGNAELINRNGELFREFTTVLWPQRQVVFKPYLHPG